MDRKAIEDALKQELGECGFVVDAAEEGDPSHTIFRASLPKDEDPHHVLMVIFQASADLISGQMATLGENGGIGEYIFMEYPSIRVPSGPEKLTLETIASGAAGLKCLFDDCEEEWRRDEAERVDRAAGRGNVVEPPEQDARGEEEEGGGPFPDPDEWKPKAEREPRPQNWFGGTDTDSDTPR